LIVREVGQVGGGQSDPALGLRRRGVFGGRRCGAADCGCAGVEAGSGPWSMFTSREVELFEREFADRSGS